MTWTKEWPKETGMYWFYGWRFKPWNNGCEIQKPGRHLVLVHRAGVGGRQFVYVAGNTFLYPEEGARGLWQKAVEPELPPPPVYEELV